MISIICLTNDKLGYLVGLIESIVQLSNDHKEIQLIIGDTGVSTETKNKIDPLVNQLHPSSRWVNLKYHFSKNNNQLVKYAIYETLCFCNNDIVFLNSGFDRLIVEKLKNNNVGIVGARLLYPNKKIQHGSVDLILSGPDAGLAYHPGRFQEENHKSWNIEKEVDAVTGALLCMNKETFLAVNGFDECYDEECQDVDLCIKVQEIGKTILYVPDLKAYHLENGTRSINSACEMDRKRFKGKWKTFFDKKKIQKLKLSAGRKNKILFKRAGARGDVLATIVLLNAFKKENPNIELHLMTKFVEIASNFDCLDRVLSWDEQCFYEQYNMIVDCSYENVIWQYATKGWFEALAINLGVDISGKSIKQMYSDLGMHLSDALFKDSVKQIGEYALIGTGAGWSERQLEAQHWNRIIDQLKSTGLKVVLAKSKVETPMDINADLVLIDLDLCELVELSKNAKVCNVLDSFLFHVALLSGNENIKLYTCKTTQTSVFGRHVADEHRSKQNTDITDCWIYGCRHKIGNGQGNNCFNAFSNF